MSKHSLREIFEHTMINDGHIDPKYFNMCNGYYVLSDIQEMFRGFRFGWYASRHLAEVEVGLQCADAGQLIPIEDVKVSWENRQS